MEERAFHPLDYVSVVRRRKWWFIVPLAVCIVGGALLVMILPKEYKSEAEIGIAAPTLSPELLRGVSALDPAERQRAISQQLLSPAVLERVVREEGINPSAPVPETAAWLRANVERNIDVPRPIGRAEDAKGLERFKLGYVDGDPVRAQRITNRLATVFVEENSKLRTERAENTAAVLEQQMRASHERLTTLQEQLRRQKEANIGRLPTQEGANQQMVNNLHSRLESLTMQLSTEQSRLTTLDSQIAHLRQMTPVITSSSASPMAAEIVAAQTRIQTLTQELAQSRALGYTDEHPDIRRINRELAAARTDLNSAKQPATSGPNREELLRTDPVYNQLTLERQLTQNRVRELQRSLGSTNAQIGLYQSRLESAPMVEQALSSLTQENELEKKRYEDLSTKYQNALVAEDLARKQGGERFSVLYPATLPSRPIKPDVMKLMLMSLALGLMLGSVMVVGREFLDRSVHDARALQSEFEIPVLGEIPRIQKVA
jgi:succinoglycan biosynthesis transport protein ExoP